MNKKYLNFSIILIVLSVFDILTTQYALSTYPNLSEGNPLMAMVTGSFILFVLVKAFGVMIIAGLYRRMKNPESYFVKAGKTVIIMMVLFAVGNNLIQIASATTSFGFPAPYELESPGRVETSGEQSYAFIGHNNYNVTEYFTFNLSANGGLDYGATNKFYSNNMVRFAVLDWAHPYRMFLVFSNLDVAYTDTPSGVSYEDGYYTENVWPSTGCSNCNDLHKIGTLTSINTQMAGLVDSNGDLYLSQGVSVVRFIRSADYAKSTYITLVAGTDYTASSPVLTDFISSMQYDTTGNLHILVSEISNQGTYNQHATVYLSHAVFSGTTKIYNEVIASKAGGTSPGGTRYYASILGRLLTQTNQSNASANIVVGYSTCAASDDAVQDNTICNTVSTKTVYLISRNSSGSSDICISSCGTISDFNGLGVYGGYAYIASSMENKIYRFPTTISVSSGNGFVPGVGTGATATANINYNTKTIQSMYANYYNTSQLLISVNIDADSGFNLLGNNYAINASLNPLSQWYYFDIINPDGVMMKQQAVGKCVDTWAPLNPTGRCTITGLYQFNAPSNGWQGGSWYAKLYESADGGHVALLTTSATWNVYGGNESLNATVISDGEEPITSTSNQATISQIDGYVGLLGFGVNSVSKFLFALIFSVVLFVIGMYYGKSGMIGLALSSFPYVFFAYIGYIPKWVFIIYVILLIVISRVFR